MNKLQQVLSNPLSFISKLKIIDKNGKLAPLRPTSEQIKIIETLEMDGDLLVLKPRQIGSSTIICAYLFWKAFTSKDPVTFAVLSHKLASSKHLLAIIKRFWENLPSTLKAPLAVDNTTELRFKNGAGIIAVSAEGKGGLRSFTCSILLMSEYAFAENPEELKATALASLNNGKLIIESTANYFNDALHKEIMLYERGLVHWNYLFFPWFDHSEYSTPLKENEDFEMDDEEKELVLQYHLTIEQIIWRRSKMSKIGRDKFTREFPISLEEAYKMTGNTYFTHEDLKYIQPVSVEAIDIVILEDVKPDDRYSIGVDVSAGVSRDYSVIYILSKMTNQPVCIYRSNKITPVELAEVIFDLSQKYNDALTIVESNNYGNTVINELRHLGFKRFWMDSDGRDWLTTSKSKVQMFENLKEDIRNGIIRNIDNITLAELRSLQVNERGTIIIPENLSSHGDSAIALSLSSIALKDVKLPEKTFLPSWIRSNRASKIIENGGVGASRMRRY